MSSPIAAFLDENPRAVLMWGYRLDDLDRAGVEALALLVGRQPDLGITATRTVAGEDSLGARHGDHLWSMAPLFAGKVLQQTSESDTDGFSFDELQAGIAAARPGVTSLEPALAALHETRPRVRISGPELYLICSGERMSALCVKGDRDWALEVAPREIDGHSVYFQPADEDGGGVHGVLIAAESDDANAATRVEVDEARDRSTTAALTAAGIHHAMYYLFCRYY